MKKILVIEDEPSIRNILSDILEDEAYHVLCAEDGFKGIELAEANQPDLILCDVMMPGMDGYEVLNQVRSLPHTITTPFIFLTAKADRPDIRQGMYLGADDYLSKPFTREELLTSISSRLKKKIEVQDHYQQKLEDLRTNISHSLPHELLTPLNGLIGLSEILRDSYDSMDSESLLEIAESLNRSAWRLERVIRNTLLYAELQLKSQDSAQPQIWQDMMSAMAEFPVSDEAQVVAKKLNREADLTLQLCNSPVQIQEPHLRKIVEELVSNACKFSKTGTPIEVVSQIEGDRYTLEVTDQGRGMTPSQIADVGAYIQFERRFYEQQGSGLGLIIVRQLTELHYGKLSIESTVGKQTKVRITLPIGSPIVID
jgi:signal transduction histidine kinase